ncbi:extracellular solute-binding protein [Streptomyces sp. B6B3]|uniref:extracellular solute-binding protein n=1 Tax=Streptomyces sp. B6B3 TaxID=3153570 RepID=UPI00325CE6EC
MPRTLRVAHRAFEGFDRALARQIEALRTTRPDIEVETVSLEIHELYQRLVADPGGPPADWDVVLCNTDWLPALIAGERLLPLDDRLAASPPPDWPEGWSPTLRGLQRGPDGATYGLPYHDGPQMLIYRTDLFEDAAERARFERRHGYPLRAPRTWTEFLDVARFFTRPGDGLYGCALAGMPDGHNNVYDFLIQLWSRGGEVLDGRRAAFADDRGRRALEYLRGLVLDHRVTQPDPREYDSVRAGDHYAGGGAAMMWNWCGFAAVAEGPDAAVRGRNGLAPIPAGTPGESVSLSVYWVMTLPRQARDPDLGWEFLRHLATPGMDRVTALEGGIGCRLSTWRDPEVRRRYPCYDLIEEVNATARLMPALPEYPDVNDVLSDAIDSVHTGAASPAEALARAAEATDALLARTDGQKGTQPDQPTRQPTQTSGPTPDQTTPAAPLSEPKQQPCRASGPVPNDTALAALSFDHRPVLPERPRPIGIVGAGAIVRAGHLPAYRAAGLPVVAIADLDADAARRVAGAFGIPTVYRSADELIADPEVEVVDIAVTANTQAPIVRAALRAGKPVLAQKPLTEDLSEAVDLVAEAAAAGVPLAVNQQMRWDPVVAGTRALIDAGWFGRLAGGAFDIDVLTDWSLWPNLLRTPRLEYFNHSIHYVDALRHLFGDPVAVTATTARFPGQRARGESRTFTVYEYTEDLVVVVNSEHNNWSSTPRAVLRCQGTEGRSEGYLGSLYDYPQGRPDVLEFVSRNHLPGHRLIREFDERWIPDAFAGPMADLQRACAEGREPAVSGRDNLTTLRLVHAAYRAAQEGRRVPLAEVELPDRTT